MLDNDVLLAAMELGCAGLLLAAGVIQLLILRAVLPFIRKNGGG